MSQWVDRIRGHRIWDVLESTGPAIDLALERESLTADDIDSLERLRTVLTFCGKRLAAADPVLVTPLIIESMATCLTNLKSQVDAFIASGDTSQLSAANDQADKVISFTVSVLTTATADDLTNLSEAASSYRTTLQKNLFEAFLAQESLEKKSRANEEKIAEISAELTNEQRRLTNLITEQQSEFSKAQDKRASDFSAAQNEQLSKYTAASAEFQTQFSADQDTRRSAFSEFQRSASEEVSDLISVYTKQLSDHDKLYLEEEEAATDAYNNKLEELQTSYTEKAAEILNQIVTHKVNVENLVGVIGNLGVTSGYQKVANRAQTMLYIWQFITIAALGGLIYVALLVAFPSGKKDFVSDAPPLASLNIEAQKGEKNKIIPGTAKPKDNVDISATPASSSDSNFYHGLATRIFLAITFGIFAGYAGRQASHFMEIEKKNRKLALELEALGPFIEPLRQEDRDKFRVQVGDRTFGIHDHESGKKNEADPVSLLSLLKTNEVQDFLTNLIKEKTK